METVSKIASGMHLVQPSHILAADYIHESFSPQLVRLRVHACTCLCSCVSV
jgi:hypothetical protein